MTPREIYKHTQIGWIMLISMGLSLALIVIAVSLVSDQAIAKQDQLILFLVFGILLICMILFPSLTVIVDDDFVQIKFGAGVIRKSFKLADIKSCAIVRNKWWYGWGIRWFPKGLIFNIWGLNAVELVMNNGKVYRIGTDEPQKLDAVIKSKLIKGK